MEYLIPTVKLGQQGVMVWGCFAKHNLGPLVKLEGRVTAAVYKKVLKINLIQFLEGLDNQDNYFFQEDNVPIHTANIIKRWKVKHKVNSISWPAQSLNLNMIEIYRMN